MGDVERIWNQVTGKAQEDAAQEAAAIQSAMGREAIGEIRAGREQLRADLSPVRETLGQSIPSLTSLLLDPSAQQNFITNNPLFQAVTTDIMQNQAAKGKLGSGDTVQLATQAAGGLLQNQIENLFNLANLGTSAAAGGGSLESAGSIANLLTQIGNVQGAGIIAGAQPSPLLQAGLTAGTAKLLSDERTKENIEHIGTTDEGINIYQYQYKGSDDIHIGVLAQEIEEKYPEAVTTRNGIKHVDYAKLGVNLEAYRGA